MTSMSLVDLPPIELSWPWPTKMVAAKLVDGPCAGRYEQVPNGAAECWTRVGKPQRAGVETQMWALYDRTAPGRFVYSGMTITTDQLQAALDAAAADGHTHGESYGA